jgi:hypothetical protein
VFQKNLCNGIPTAVWRVLRKRLHSKAYKLSIVQDFSRLSCRLRAALLSMFTLHVSAYMAIFKLQPEDSVNIDKKNAKPSKIKLHADGNLTSKVIEQYSATGC